MEGMDSLLQGMSREYLIAMVVISVVFQAVWLILAYNIRLALLRIKPENRFLSPNHAWVIAIPLINIYYNFVVIRKLSDTLNNEFFDRKIAVDENPTLKQGQFMAYAYLAANFPLPMFIGYLVMGMCLVCYINYLAKIIEYKKLLKEDYTLPNDTAE